MDIRVDPYLSQSSGDFGTRVSHDDRGGVFLDVPPDLWRFLEYAVIQPMVAEVFVAYVWTFPGALRFSMGWTIAEVEAARDRLCSQLQGLVDSRFLRSTTEPSRTHFLSQ